MEGSKKYLGKNIMLMLVSGMVAMVILYYGGMFVWNVLLQNEFEEASVKAKNGDADAMLVVGMMYDSGMGTTKDHASAISMYKLAAKNNNKNAQFILCGLHDSGELDLNDDEGRYEKWCDISNSGT